MPKHFSHETSVSQTDVEGHHAYEQVILDVNRCAGRLKHIRQLYLPHLIQDDTPVNLTEKIDEHNSSDTEKSNEGFSDGNSVSKSSGYELSLDEDKLKNKLVNIIVKLLILRPHLHYYQGFHDVCLTYMSLEEETRVLDRLLDLVDSHFQLFMKPTMEETQEFLALIPVIIGMEDREVKNFLDEAQVGTIFALSWVITWFSHVIPSEEEVEKIFRFLEHHEPHLVLYLSAAIVIHKRNQLLRLDCDMSSVHHFLCQVPKKEKLPIDDLLEKALILNGRWSIIEVKKQYKYAKMQLNGYNMLRQLTSTVVNSRLSNLVQNRAVILVVLFASVLVHQWTRY